MQYIEQTFTDTIVLNFDAFSLACFFHCFVKHYLLKCNIWILCIFALIPKCHLFLGIVAWESNSEFEWFLCSAQTISFLMAYFHNNSYNIQNDWYNFVAKLQLFDCPSVNRKAIRIWLRCF